MRDQWTRADEQLPLSESELELLCSPAFACAKVLNRQNAQGGLANTNIRVHLKEQQNPVLVRIYTRDGTQAEKEFRINKLVRDTVPTPEIFYFSNSNPVNGLPYMIMQWIEAPRLELVWDKLSAFELDSLARSTGKVLHNIHAFKFASAGFFDSKLKVVHHLDLGSSGLRSFARECLLEKNGRERLSQDLTDKTLSFIDKCAPLLDRWQSEPCLTHSDFGGSNILVHDIGGGFEIAAVLDWEFAFCGSPLFDFGNLLRPPLGKNEVFSERLVQSYKEAGGQLPADWKRLIRLVDLSAWLDFLSRPNLPDSVAVDAKSAIADTMSLFEHERFD